MFSLGPFPNRPRTLFRRAIEASKLKWDDKHLQRIIKDDTFNYRSGSIVDIDMFDYQGMPMWNGKYTKYTSVATLIYSVLKTKYCEST